MELKDRIETLGINSSHCPVGINKPYWRKMLRMAKAGEKQSVAAVAVLELVCDVEQALLNIRRKPGLTEGNNWFYLDSMDKLNHKCIQLRQKEIEADISMEVISEEVKKFLKNDKTD